MIDTDLVSPPESAALDEAILEAHIQGLVPNTLHFYRREVPTVSVGYFQRVGDTTDLGECMRRHVAIVRRKSGGSSIFTDSGQLVYGLVVRESDLPRDRAESYRTICSALASAIGSFGVNAVYRPLNDVEVAGRKVSGSAQLRRKGSVLHHGTVIVDTDLGLMDAVLKVNLDEPSDPKRPSDRVTSLRVLLGSAPAMGAVKNRLEEELGSAFGIAFEKGQLCDQERAIVRRLVEERYSKESWTMRF